MVLPRRGEQPLRRPGEVHRWIM